ncbi:MAG: hypothetical protein RIS90_2017 [Pseudomonadota bacterium]|jgi:hypothetical protein
MRQLPFTVTAQWPFKPPLSGCRRYTMRAITTDLRYAQNRHDALKLLYQTTPLRASQPGVS